MSNVDNKIISIQSFYGGQSADQAIGTPGSFSYSKALDHRKRPSQLSVLPGPRNIAGGVVTDLITNIVQSLAGIRYGYGDTGNVYKIDTSNVVTYATSTGDGGDLLYRSDLDAIYFTTSTEVKRYFPISNSPTIDQTYGASKSIDTNAYRTGGTNEYSVPIAIDEGQSCSFQPDIEPFYSIKVNIKDKGTGDWTLTLHDGLNTSLASVTVTNANISGGLTEFRFSSQIRALVKPNARTYHYHLTSTVADGTVYCSTSNNLNTADFELWAYRLVDTTNGLHPIAQFLQYVLIGNGNYLAVWEPLSPSDPPNNEFERHRLVFPPGFEVCGIAVTDEFAVIACEKKSTDGTKDFQEGKLFIWDGISKTYNQIINVDNGSPQSVFAHDNYPHFIVNGDLCAWPGGKDVVKVRKIADTDTRYTETVDNTYVLPHMMTSKDNLLHIGYPSYTTSLSIEHGVYVWGTLDKNYPSSFNYGYVISTETNKNTSGNLMLGCVRNFGDEMYISWKDGTSYGLDIVDSFCDPAPTFSFRMRRFDAGAGYKEKQALRMSIDTSAIPSGVTLSPTYQVDNESEETNDSMLQSSERIVSTIPSTKGIFKRITCGFDGTCDGTEAPVIYSYALQWNALPDRKAL